MLLRDLTKEIEKESIFDLTPFMLQQQTSDRIQPDPGIPAPGQEDAMASREAPIFDNYSDSDDEAESFSGNYLGLTITSTPQKASSCTGRALSPQNYSKTPAS